MSTLDGSSSSPRVLACLLCQQRKVKCDRKSPCANCIKSGARCVPAIKAPRPSRRRRFPEKDLLDRVKHYERLLRDNNIAFEPLSGSTAPDEDNTSRASAEPGGQARTFYEPKKLWHALAQRSRDSDDEDTDDSSIENDLREATVKKAWDQYNDSNDFLFFGMRTRTDLNLSILHPEQVHVFRLWQIYLDNVNPLLKVTHTPSLQVRIIDAASDVTSIDPALEALMFSIYCVAVLSLGEDQCQSLFGSPKDDLLRSYQFGCQQALIDCRFLRSTDRNCLTAFFLYLVSPLFFCWLSFLLRIAPDGNGKISIRPDVDPRSLSTLLAVAIRIAQRLGIHNESTFVKYTALEAEMCRRLWWSLILFDNRICEISDHRTTVLNPIWSCRTPLNINDFDILPEMREMPAAHQQPTETLFAVVRSQLGDLVRHSDLHLDFTSPSLKAIAAPKFSGNIDLLENMMEQDHLKFCNPENPLHFMIIWTTRGYLAKCRLMEHFARYLRFPARQQQQQQQQTDSHRNAAVSLAIRMLDCDTKLMMSPLTKGYLWFIRSHFPFPAYIHLLQDLKKRPLEAHSQQVWDAMSSNYRIHFDVGAHKRTPLFHLFSNVVLQAWTAYEEAYAKLGQPQEMPSFVIDVQKRVKRLAEIEISTKTELDVPTNAFVTPYVATEDITHDIGGGGGGGGGGQGGHIDWDQFGNYPEILPQAPLEIDVSQMDWSTMNWN